MPAITLDRMELGMDRRKGRGVSDANRLYELKNAFISGGWVPQKRPGLTKITSTPLSTGLAKGILPFNGKLQVFYKSGGAPGTLPTVCNANPVGAVSGTLDYLLDGEVFNGFPYVTLLQTGTLPSVTRNDVTFTAPSSINAAAGLGVVVPGSAIRVSGSTQNDGIYTVSTVAPTGVLVNETTIVTDAVPTAATTLAETTRSGHYIDGSAITLTTGGEAPFGPVERAAQRLFIPDGDNNDQINFCALADANVWSGGTSGFLPTGLNAVGSPTPQALGLYQDRLAVIHRDGVQTWDMDPDPTLMSLGEIVPNVGSIYPRSIAAVGTDLYMLSEFGFLSLSILTVTQNLADVDVGAPINALVVADLAAVTNVLLPKAMYVRSLGQYWCSLGSKVWVYTFSRASRVSAWSYYTFPFTVVDMCELESVVYLLGDDRHIYKLDPSVHQDAGVSFEVMVEYHFLSANKPGQLKHVIGADAVLSGNANLKFRYNANAPADITDAIAISGDSRSEGLIPVELVATEIAPQLTYTGDAAWRLDALTLYYEILGTQ